MKLEGISQKIAVIGGIIAISGSLGGGVIAVTHYFTPMSIHMALAGEVAEVKKTQQYMGFSYQQRSVEDRMNKLEDRYQDKQMPQSVKEEYKNLNKQNDELKTILQDLTKKNIESVR